METRETSADCQRQEELVTYLYDEATPSERTSFESHISDCSICRTEVSAFSRVRQNLGVWNLAAISESPRMGIVIKRGSLETLRELVGMLWTLPVLVRTAGVGATAVLALLFAFALAGTRIDFREGTLSFGGIRETKSSNETAKVDETPEGAEATLRLTRAEIETMIAERVAAAGADDRKHAAEMRAQISSLTAQLSSSSRSQTRLAASLATLRTEQRELAARGQATLGEWLFAANEPREPWGGDDEKEK